MSIDRNAVVWTAGRDTPGVTTQPFVSFDIDAARRFLTDEILWMADYVAEYFDDLAGEADRLVTEAELVNCWTGDGAVTVQTPGDETTWDRAWRTESTYWLRRCTFGELVDAGTFDPVTLTRLLTPETEKGS